MKLKLFFIFLLFLLALSGSKSAAQNKFSKTIYQTSPISALVNGFDNDSFTVAEIKKHGDFGLGTFNGVNGEMIILNGKVYRADYTGKISMPDNSWQSPFVTEIYFHADTSITLKDTLSFSSLENFINKIFPSKNIICAIKIEGLFKYVQYRSEKKQTAAYSNIVDVIKQQFIYNMSNINGTMVGFYYPDYLKDVNAAGYHFHFLSLDKKLGGHVLNLMTKNIKIQIEYADNLDMRVPKAAGFYKIKLQN